MSQKKIKFFLIILALSFVTDLYPTTTDIYLLIVFFITAFYFHFKDLEYDPGIIFIIIFFILINLVNALFFGMFQITTLVGMILRLLIPYYILKILDIDFIIIFEKTIYFLAILSIPLYILQLIKPDTYYHLNPFFRPMMTDLRYSLKIYSYVLHTIHTESLSRNSGFAWEPGGFGYVLGIAIMFNVVRYNFVITKKAIILLLVGLTTLSTTFYIFVLVLFSFYLYERKKKPAILYFALPLIVFIFIFTYQLPFMSEKIEKNMSSRKFLESKTITNPGRFGGLYYEYKRFSEYPLGYGINSGGKWKDYTGEMITGASGIGSFLRMWGIIGFLLLIYTLYNLSNRLSTIYQNKNKIFVMITILLFLFSNPIARDPTFLMLVYFPLFIMTKKNVVINIYNAMVTVRK